jgi:hypothetical protein
VKYRVIGEVIAGGFVAVVEADNADEAAEKISRMSRAELMELDEAGIVDERELFQANDVEEAK